jgi:hypothetical protein
MAEPVVLKDGTTSIERLEKFDGTFAYCWELIRPKGREEWIYTKGGAIEGFFAHVLFFRNSGVTVAICANSQGNFNLLDLGIQIKEAIDAAK